MENPQEYDKIVAITFEDGVVYGIGESGILYRITGSGHNKVWALVATPPKIGETNLTRQHYRKPASRIDHTLSNTPEQTLCDANETPVPRHNVFDGCPPENPPVDQ